MFSKKIKRTLYIGAAILVLPLAETIWFFTHNQDSERPKQLSVDYYECDHVRNPTIPVEPAARLFDKNEVQLLHAQANGIKIPFSTDSDFNARLPKLLKQSVLFQVRNNRYYELKNLTLSHPYLIPEAIDMLNEIGYRFQESLKKKHLPQCKFRLTSLLRTGESQSTLTRRNRNATRDVSCHLYGTTVDISYKDFLNARTDSVVAPYTAVAALTNVLIEMRKECKLLAVRERHQSCFHITVVCCKAKGVRKDRMDDN